MLSCLAIPFTAAAQNQSAHVTGVEHGSTGDRVRIIIYLDAPVQYVEGTALDPFRIFFDLQGATPAPELHSKIAVGDPVVQRVRVAQYQPGITRVVLDMAEQAPYTVTFVPKPPQLVVEVMRTGPAVTRSRPPVQPATAATVATPPKSLESRQTALPPQPSPRVSPTEVASTTPPAVAPRPVPAAPVRQQPPAVTQSGTLAARFEVGAPEKATLASELLPAAQHGDAKAQFQVAELYMEGRGGVKRDPTLAANWYLQAAQQGHALAAANLGVLYANGLGLSKSDGDAVTWFRKAAEAGDPGGQNNLGAMYITGRGVQQDDTLGAKWVLLAAEQGIPEAEYTMGTLCANGRGVPRDDAQAAAWLQKAATQGYPMAQLALGKLYLSGTGVTRDYRQAMKLFQSANLPEASYQAALLYQQGLGVVPSDSEAAVWLLKAAERGYPDAQYAVGRFYMDRDPVEAYSWFAVAASGGDQQGVAAMNSLAPRLTPQQLATAQKRALDLATRVTN